MVVNEDYYYSDSDSDDDDDVDRYVFLARQPAPEGRHHAEDGASSEDGDDGGDATEDEEGREGGGGRRKRPLREVVLDAAPSPKKARLGPITSPLGQMPPSGSESASSPCGVREGESVCEQRQEQRAPREGEAKNRTKKQGVCGKRSRGPVCEEDDNREQRRAVTAAAKTGTSSAATSGRFLCNLCERCFDSHQALGGHVLGHRKKARIAIASAASLDDAGGIDNCKEETAVVEVSQEAANGIAAADKKTLVAARLGKASGEGNCDVKRTVDDFAEHREDVDSGGRSKAEKASFVAEDHNCVHGEGNSGLGEPVFAASHEDVNGNDGFGNKGNDIAVSGHGFTSTNGDSSSNEKMGIGAANSKQKVAVGTCHEGANGNSNVCKTRHKCKVCGTECPTGRALRGHMRKHRKRPPPGGGDGDGGEGRPPSPATDEDCQVPLARLFGAEICLQRDKILRLVE